MAMENLFSNLFYILEGLPVTLELTAYGLALGFILGFPLATLRVYGGKEAKSFVAMYERTLRSIPLLIIIFILYFGFSQEIIRIPAFLAVSLSLGIRSSAYQSQIFRGAIESIGRGQMDAALSIGLTRIQAIRHVILPQVLRLALPSWSNEAAIVIKDTSFAFIFGIAEVMRRANYIRAVTYDPLTPFLIVAAIYFIIVFPLTKIIGTWGKRKTEVMVGRKS
ncbi:MAG: amino acid ABC transporter permease [Candidatus Bathyarchaeota archaeon]|nr:amino acid ABC transporter permease [Candidatus Bathyarchaeota archaeon]